MPSAPARCGGVEEHSCLEDTGVVRWASTAVIPVSWEDGYLPGVHVGEGRNLTGVVGSSDLSGVTGRCVTPHNACVIVCVLCVCVCVDSPARCDGNMRHPVASDHLVPEHVRTVGVHTQLGPCNQYTVNRSAQRGHGTQRET